MHFLLLVVIALSCSSLSADSVSTRPPNIIFILADDLGWGDVGFNGQKHIRTPRLDAMAAEGLVFTQFYSGSSVCMPARATLMLGQHLGHARIRGNPTWSARGVPVDLDVARDTTVAAELKRAGYRTASFGKWGLEESGDDSGLPNRAGFDDFFGILRHSDAHHNYPPHLWRNGERVPQLGNDLQQSTGAYAHDVIFCELQAWLKERRLEQPFFLYWTPTLPHAEFNVPEDSKAPYRGLGWPERPMNRTYYKNDPEGNVAYAGMVSRLDRDVGRLLDQLRAQGLADNTLVIFTSDNGPEYEREDRFFNSNGPFRGGKRDLYEGGIRVPGVAWWPGKIVAGSRTPHVAAFWDFLPTACELAGIKPTRRDLDGLSLAPLLRGEGATQPSHRLLYWEFNESSGPVQAVRFGDWKAVLRWESDLELYNIADDPGESQNLAGAQPAVVEQARALLVEARTPSDDFPLTKRKSFPSPLKKYD